MTTRCLVVIPNAGYTFDDLSISLCRQHSRLELPHNAQIYSTPQNHGSHWHVAVRWDIPAYQTAQKPHRWI